MAQYDFGMTLEEFGRCTPGIFAALIKRQGVRFKRDCYIAGVTASTVVNCTPRGKDARMFNPFDFVPDMKRADKRDELKKKIMAIFGTMMEFGRSPAEMDKARERIEAKFRKAGHEDIREVFDEIFPSWAKQGAK